MKKLILLLCLAAFSFASRAQEVIEIKGKVTKEDNTPLSGVTVIVKQTSAGTKTGEDGQFSIRAAVGQTLQFSYVGTSDRDIVIRDASFLTVQLQEKSLLDEVVVVGYGTVKRKDLTGAIASVSGQDIQSDLAKSAAGALQGRIAGVNVSNAGGQPGAGMSINIRGLSSLGSNTPLYVIDGVYGDINLVDPVDIASLEVLKDASAAAIYGSRAANGVVLITTKSGRRNMPATLQLNAFTGVQNITKKLDVLDAQQWKQVMKQTGYLPPEAVDFTGKGTNWQDEVYRTAPINKVNLGLAGGSDNVTYNISAGYLNQQGVLINSGYDAFNFRAKNTFSFFNNSIRLGNTLLIRTSENERNRLTITDPLRQNPLLGIKDADQLGGYAGIAPWMKNMDNPVGYSNLFDSKVYQNDILLNAYAEVDLGVQGLRYRFNFGLNKTNGRNFDYNDPYDFGSGAVQSKLSENAFFNNQWLAENTVNYDNTFQKHTISGLIGYSAQKNSNRGFGAGRNDIPFGTNSIGAGATTQQTTSGSLQEYSLLSMFSRVMYSYDSRYMLSASVRRDGSSRFAEGYRYGLFPSVSVGWNIMNEDFFGSAKDKMDELKLRLSYGVLGNQEIGNYSTQSISSSGINYIQGGNWWMGANTGVVWVSPKNLTWEETRTSNIGVDMSFLNSKFSLSADYYIQETHDVLLSIGMPPSTGLGGSPTMNAGVIENKGFELLLNHRNSAGKFKYEASFNISSVSNKVKKVTVGSTQEFGGYNPQGEGTITWAKVGQPIGAFYVIKTDGIFQNEAEVKAHTFKDGTLIQPDAKPGDIRFIDFNGDGKISDDDRQYAGSPFPDFTFGLRGSVQYEGFDLSFFFDGMQGNKIYNYTRARMESMNEFTNFSTNALKAWTPENPNTDIPRFTQEDKNKNARRVSDRWLEDGSFIRLKVLELGYNFTNSFTEKAHLKNARVFLAGENLVTFTKYTGYTPDLGQNNDLNGGGSSTMSRGTDHGRFPLARTIMVGLQVSF